MPPGKKNVYRAQLANTNRLKACPNATAARKASTPAVLATPLAPLATVARKASTDSLLQRPVLVRTSANVPVAHKANGQPLVTLSALLAQQAAFNLPPECIRATIAQQASSIQ